MQIYGNGTGSRGRRSRQIRGLGAAIFGGGDSVAARPEQ